jgi:hypothetical protein
MIPLFFEEGEKAQSLNREPVAAIDACKTNVRAFNWLMPMSKTLCIKAPL